MPSGKHLHNGPPYMTPPKDAKCLVDTVPDEIVIRIFIAVVEAAKLGGSKTDPAPEDDYEDTSSTSGHHSFATQLQPQEVLSHVCKRWRAIALDMPALWKYIDFSDGPPFDRSREWIRRTKDHPFDIVLECTSIDDMLMGSDDEDDEELGEAGLGFSSYDLGQVDRKDLPIIRDIILPHISHWGSFIFITDDVRVMDETLSALSNAGEASQLETMLLSFDWHPLEDMEDASRLYAPFGGRAPRLRKLELIRTDLDWSRSSFLQGTSLTSLKIISQIESMRPTFHEFTRALGSCSDLTNLELSNFGPGGNVSSWPAGSVTELPSLRWLSISNYKTSYLARLLRHLRFPQLHTLVAKISPLGTSEAVVAAFCEAVSLQHIIDLHVEGIRVTDGEVASRFWTDLKNLDTLRIDHLTIIGGGFLAVWKQEKHFPRVDSLMVSGVGGRSLESLVRAREHNHPLRRLGIAQGSAVTREQDAWLRQHVPEVGYFTDSHVEA